MRDAYVLHQHLGVHQNCNNIDDYDYGIHIARQRPIVTSQSQSYKRGHRHVLCSLAPTLSLSTSSNNTDEAVKQCDNCSRLKSWVNDWRKRRLFVWSQTWSLAVTNEVQHWTRNLYSFDASSLHCQYLSKSLKQHSPYLPYSHPSSTERLLAFGALCLEISAHANVILIA